MHDAFMLAQDGGETAATAGGLLAGVFGLVCWLGMMVGFGALMFWGIFKKAGVSPAMSLIPIVNLYFLLQVVGKPAWWLLLFFIPLVNLFAIVMVCLEIARRFGKDTGYAVGLILLGIVFFPLLGFGDAKYNASPAAAA